MFLFRLPCTCYTSAYRIKRQNISIIENMLMKHFIILWIIIHCLHNKKFECATIKIVLRYFTINNPLGSKGEIINKQTFHVHWKNVHLKVFEILNMINTFLELTSPFRHRHICQIINGKQYMPGETYDFSHPMLRVSWPITKDK